MFLRKVIPVWAALSCVCFSVPLALAQVDPTEEELESARQRLQHALEAGALPPAAFESDPVPDWAVPHHTPKVLPAPGITAQPTERANTEVVDPNILSSQQSAEEKPETKRPAARQQEKPKKPAVAHKKEPPKLKTGRASTDGEKKKTQKRLPGTSPAPAPIIVLPGTLRP